MLRCDYVFPFFFLSVSLFFSFRQDSDIDSCLAVRPAIDLWGPQTWCTRCDRQPCHQPYCIDWESNCGNTYCFLCLSLLSIGLVIKKILFLLTPHSSLPTFPPPRPLSADQGMGGWSRKIGKRRGLRWYTNYMFIELSHPFTITLSVVMFTTAGSLDTGNHVLM